MMTKDEALKMAYKAEETGNLQDLVDAVNALMEALEQKEVGDAEIRQMLNDIEYYQKRVEALEQPAQEPLTRAQQVILANNKALEPVAWLENGNVNWAKYPNDQSKPIPLYAHPHQWQGLTDDDVKAIEEVLGIDKVYIRAIERALKEKNT